MATGWMHRAITPRIGACTTLRHALFDAKNRLSFGWGDLMSHTDIQRFCVLLLLDKILDPIPGFARGKKFFVLYERYKYK